MKTYKYIIIGGGMTGSAAVAGIRRNDANGTIAMFSDESYGPYNRPPLTKALWSGMQIYDIMRPTDTEQLDLFLETRIVKIEPQQKRILTKAGEQFSYEKLLLATGAHPITLPGAPEGVIYYRTRADYERVRELAHLQKEFCVVGGGFIGSEITAALTKANCQVTMIFPEIGIAGKIFPDALSEFLNAYYQDKGAVVLPGHIVTAIQKEDEKFIVRYQNKRTKEPHEKIFDSVIVGIGVRPNVSLAQEAGIDIEDGILVNTFLQTNLPDIFAAGDCAVFIHQGLDKRIRVEHEDNANKMGMRAGLNMSGEMKPYDHFPFFYSDLFDLGYEALGELNKQFEIFSDWIDPFKKGNLYYLNNDKIRGLVFWNLWGKVDQGRVLIKTGEKVTRSALKGLINEDE